jgi:Flp pilus assembly protein TadB
MTCVLPFSIAKAGHKGPGSGNHVNLRPALSSASPPRQARREQKDAGSQEIRFSAQDLAMLPVTFKMI